MFGLHSHRHRTHTWRIHPLAIVGLCLVAAVLLTLLVGNLLKNRLDDETYKKLTSGSEEEQPSVPQTNAKVRQIKASSYMLGDDINNAIGKAAVSVAINRPNGTLAYTSDVSALLGCPRNEELTLADSIGTLSAYVPYISGVFYPQAFSQPSTDTVYAVAAQETALLREFFYAGGSEILLCNLPLDAEHTDTVILYLKTVKAALPDTAVGVAIPFAIASDAEAWEILATVSKYCDFLAVDLTDQTVTDAEPNDTGISSAAQKLLSDCQYFLSEYNMRILLSDAQTELLTALELKLCQNYQMIPAFTAEE